MKSKTDSCTSFFAKLVETPDSLQEWAIADFCSDPRLQIVQLNEREYMEALIAYRSQHNELEMMLESIFQAIEIKMGSQESYNILSIGCGSGIFEKIFVKKLLESKKKIHFVGVDPNKQECKKTKEWCEKLRISQLSEFSFNVYPVRFNSVQLLPTFDIILSIHSFYYVDKIEPSIRKSYELLNESGIAIVGIAPRTKNSINEPYYYIYQRLHGTSPWFSEDVENVLTECNLPFRQQTIEFAVNITECFQKESELGKPLLDFLLGTNTTYLFPFQLQILLDYLDRVSQKMEDGEIVFSHSGTLFYFDKIC